MLETQTQIRDLLALATLLPLASAALVIFFGRYLRRHAGWFTFAVMVVSFGLSAWVLALWLGQKPGTVVWNIPWIPAGGGRWLYLGLLADGLTIATMAMVTLISALVHLYSIGYMAGDKRYHWFFAYLSLFTFSMLGIVISNSLMQLFVFWELVGLTSYLLIGFWFERRGPQQACKKAFVMNRIGDAGFLVGFGILFYQLGGRVLLPAAEGVAGLDGATSQSMLGALQELLARDGHSILNPPWWLTLAGIGLFAGAMGKSAQFPLHTWLPDAMEGPTPVSSIVHSATMVAAGVYLTARIYPILTPGAHLFIATIGLITLVMAACMALVMTDIKRVLAYSTLSQLGYMVLALGAGAYTFALFHLVTHAFFKCCLFQCAGSVIHAAHHQQDMRYYGGLWNKMPITATCYAICTLAIAGASIPFGHALLGVDIGMSGFYSKDGMLAGTYFYGEAMRLGEWNLAAVFYIAPMAVAYLTVFYMGRSFALTFLGKPRDPHLHEHAHEAPVTMLIPQLVLAVLAIIAAVLPIKFLIDQSTEAMLPLMAAAGEAPWVQTTAAIEDPHGAMHTVHLVLLYGLGWIIALAAAILLYLPGFRLSARIAALPGVNLIYTWFVSKFYFDTLYDYLAVSLGKAVALVAAAFDQHIVDGLVNLAGFLARLGSSLVGRFDLRVVDGAVNGAAVAVQSGGQVLRATQPGRVRVYVLCLFAISAVVMLAVMTVVLAGAR